ncbi:nucleoside-diphosphate-sugar epimerase [Emticicia aquatilis]|uniref:Nucleoside-diphosphate-sugar epimerase n=1 Tax=Emticicia aquatilis TaxID=1537369 RepID=A0A916YWD5_9BACT|nr:NAD-dependent epimerase/dehydratase family protein [Emticicia aquatilis]GGD64494.1 nucleoside-diphosphate-sugar epimerase [Emticicia aquatilis]
MYNIQISGITGFIGKNLKKYLEINENNVSEVLLRNNNQDLIRLETDTIIHLAGKAHDTKKKTKLEEYYEVNTALTKKLFDAFLASNAKVFITLSSVKAVADSVDGILTEEVIPNPSTHYGKSKLLAEQYIFSKPIPNEKRVYVLRPCMVHGNENKGNLNLLYKIVSKGIPYPLGCFENKRSFLSITNLCFVIDELIHQEDIPSGIYNVADEIPLSTNRLITLMGEVLNRRSKIWFINQSVIRFIAKIGSICHLPLDTERLQKLTENYIVSSEKLLKALKKPLPISSEAGLRITIKCFADEKL